MLLQVAKAEAVEEWQKNMREYLKKCVDEGRNIRALLVIDARQSLRGLDRDFALFLDREAHVPIKIVMSKCDLVPAEELAKVRAEFLVDGRTSLSLRM